MRIATRINADVFIYVGFWSDKLNGVVGWVERRKRQWFDFEILITKFNLAIA